MFVIKVTAALKIQPLEFIVNFVISVIKYYVTVKINSRGSHFVACSHFFTAIYDEKIQRESLEKIAYSPTGRPFKVAHDGVPIAKVL